MALGLQPADARLRFIARWVGCRVDKTGLATARRGRIDSRVALVEQRQAGYPKMKTGIIPTTPEFLREALIVIGGAVIAVIVRSKIPALKAFNQKNTGGCDCESH